MGTSFEQLFREAASAEAIIKSGKLTQSEMIDATRTAIQTLECQKTEITGKAVSELVGIPRSTLIQHQEIAKLINDAESQRVQGIESALAKRAVSFLIGAHERGELCSQDTLALELGISRAKLRRSENLMKLLRSQSQL